MKNIDMPFIVDKVTNKPSITLTFAYVSFVLIVTLTIVLAFSNIELAIINGLFLFFGCAALYKMRQWDKISFSKKGFEIEDTKNAKSGRENVDVE